MWAGSSIARKRTFGLFAAHPTMNSRERGAGDICMLPITSCTSCEVRPQGWRSPCASINATASRIFA